MTTVWQRLRDAGRTGVSFPSFRRYVIETIRSVDPARLTVLMPDPAFGGAMEIDYGRLGMWTDPIGARRRTVWAFVATPRASGLHFVRPVVHMDKPTWLTCHTEALAFFGGSPRFWSLYDPKLNRAYRELAEHHDAIVDPARPFIPKTASRRTSTNRKEHRRPDSRETHQRFARSPSDRAALSRRLKSMSALACAQSTSDGVRDRHKRAISAVTVFEPARLTVGAAEAVHRGYPPSLVFKTSR